MSRILKRNWIPAVGTVVYLAFLYWVAVVWAAPRQWFVSATGSGTTCNIGSPCTIAYVFHTAKPAPGDSVEVRAGTYSPTGGGIGAKLAPEWSGTATTGCSNYQPCANDITIEAYNHEHFFVDCNVNLQVAGDALCTGAENAGNGNYVQWRNVDVGNSNNGPRWINSGAENTCTNAAQCNNAAVASGTGVKFINVWLHDGYNAVQNSGAAACGIFVYGSVIYNNGYLGSDRGHGHSLYVENQYSQGETCRSWFQDNVMLHQFNIDVQAYSAGSFTNAYQTFDHDVASCMGHAAYPTLTWSPCGVALSPGMDLYGSAGSVAECAVGCSDKIAESPVINGFMQFTSAGGQLWSLGYLKGSHNATFTNNYLAGSGNPLGLTICTAHGTGTCDPPASGPCTVAAPCGTYSPLTITGNTFFGAPNGSGGPAPAFTTTNYPNNTFNSGLPAAGSPNQIFYRSNQYETGRGFAVIYDWHNDTNVNIDLCQMGGFNGEQYQLFNQNDPNPYTGTAVSTGTITGCPTPFLFSAPIAAPTIATLSGDGTVPNPPDTGAQFFTVYLLYPNWTAPAGTPTPTNTFTSTNTPTNTNTATLTPSNTVTNTPTLTPSNTVTNTPTFTPSNTPTPTPTPQGINNTLTFPVQNCTAMPPMTIVADTASPSGFHASSTIAGQGDLVCPFNVPADGTYRVWVMMSTPDFFSDAFFIDVDGDNGFFSLTPTPTPSGNTPTPTPTPGGIGGHVFDTAEQKQPCASADGNICNYFTLGWPMPISWNMMNDRLATCPLGSSSPNCTGTFTERDLALTVAGNPHYLTFRNREAGQAGNVEGTRVYFFQLTTCLNCDPPPLLPTPTPGVCQKWIVCNHKAQFANVPCSMLNSNFIPCPWK